MSNDIQLLIEAIQSIKPEDNLFKDYIFPITTAFFSSLLGGAVAYFTFKHQDAVLFEKEKLNTTNKWIILGSEAIHSLRAIKQNYFGQLEDSPFQRMLATPPIIGQYTQISESLSGLYFISPKAKPGKPDFSKWSQIALIHALFKNYNLVLAIWEKRNELDIAVKSKLLATYSKQAFGKVDESMIKKCIPIADLVGLIDLTERAIKLTDDLIIEINDFLEHFPTFAESKIKMNKLKSYGTILRIQNTRESTYFHTRCCEANYELVSDIFGRSAEDLKNRYSTGYEEHI